MRYSDSPQVTGAHLRAVDFSEPTTASRDEPQHESVVSPPDAGIPTPRTSRRHVPPPVLTDYPDVEVTTPDRQVRTWVLPTSEDSGFDTVTQPGGICLAAADVPDDPRRSLVFRGALIGMITTRRPTHICEFPHGYASTSLRCAGCRWFETRVFRLADADSRRLNGARYVLHYVGRSIVPGEVNLPRHELAISGHEVVEAYTVRKHNERPFITKPGARVLAQAANYDADIEDAYINRATA